MNEITREEVRAERFEALLSAREEAEYELACDGGFEGSEAQYRAFKDEAHKEAFVCAVTLPAPAEEDGSGIAGDEAIPF